METMTAPAERPAPGGEETGAAIAAARSGDERAFTVLLERHRPELRVHCYRMLASLEDAEDMVQETFLRAWRGRAGFEGRSSLRSWLYRIATNVSLDLIDRRGRRLPSAAGAGEAGSEVPWLEPFPDALIDELPAPGPGPGERAVERETIELAFLAAVQHLPPRQRAVLILRGVLGWPAAETAATLETSVASVNSALQRARAGLRRHLPARRTEWGAGDVPSDEEAALVRRYVEANDSADVGAFLELMSEDVRFTMPPQEGVWVGREEVVAAWQEGGYGEPSFGELRSRVVSANRQPAVATYVRRPGDSTFRAMALDVLRIEDGLIAEIVTFGPASFGPAGLPPRL